MWYTRQQGKKYRLFTTGVGAQKIIIYLLLASAQKKSIKVFHVEQAKKVHPTSLEVGELCEPSP